MRLAAWTTGCLLAAAAAAARQGADAPPVFDELARRRVLSMSPLGAPPPDPTNAFADDERAARLGQRLFFDARLSSNGEISCATCHDPALELSDGKPLAEGLGTTSRRSPSLWNVAHQRWLFWDGRADSLWAQALQPIESELEMGGDRLAVARTVAADPLLQASYEALFGALPPLADAARFPARAKPMPEAPDDPRARAWAAMRDEDRRAVDGVFANVGKALAAYERRLVTAPAPFDRFVEGLRADDPEKLGALEPAAQRGLLLFVGRAGCRTCHLGPLFSDGEFHNLSLPTADGGPPRDPGRYAGLARLAADPFNGAGPHSDDRRSGAARIAARPGGAETWGEFRTPSLRGVTRRGPFMHRGQFADLDAVLHFYSTLEGAAPGHAHQERVLVPLQLSARELADLKAFLTALEAPAAAPEWLQPPPQPGG